MAKISISITDKQAGWLEEAVASGDYTSTSEVIRDALRDWCAKQELRRLWDEGIASGGMEELDMDEIKAAARRSLAAE